MNLRFLPYFFCFLPYAASAAMPYRSEQIKNYPEQMAGENDSESFARERRFYIGGNYNFSMWQNGADDMVSITGNNNTSFEGVIGVRLYDTFRLEANYYNLKADWDAFSISGNTAFVNAIFDARIDSMYRIFHKQVFVPYVGFGAGLSWNSVEGAAIEDKISPAVSALVGIGIEMGSRFTLDLGYRYLYMFSPKFDVIENFSPSANQFRIGARINF
ncbi:MAG: outer membrane beta-barrel protein [Alphaproteobacteria bacterium]|nr:outer membrane beta-barrel protein [Alphaproteobacteria bacterium]MBN2675404.1 outer membrane beta-barrel protein [Alphaproteobacteria bacterium]